MENNQTNSREVFQTLATFFKSIGLFPNQEEEFTINLLKGLHGTPPLQSPSFRTNYFAFLLIDDADGSYKIDNMPSIGATLVNAGALITGSPINRMIGNIFLTIDNPPIPFKLLTDVEQGKAMAEGVPVGKNLRNGFI